MVYKNCLIMFPASYKNITTAKKRKTPEKIWVFA